MIAFGFSRVLKLGFETLQSLNHDSNFIINYFCQERISVTSGKQKDIEYLSYFLAGNGGDGGGNPAAMRAEELTQTHVLSTPLMLLWTLTSTPCIMDCIMAELEKHGQKFRVALR
ncbi:hypothetical protein R6Q59_035741 [Mikania micrantha]